MSFEEAGVRLSVKGADDFFGSLKSAEKAVSDFSANIAKQADLIGFAQNIKAVNDALKGTASASTAAVNAVNKIGTASATAATQTNTLVTATEKTKTAATTQASAFNTAVTALGSFAGAVGGAVAKLPGLAADAAVAGVKALAGAAGSAVGALGNMAAAAGGAVLAGLKGIANAAADAAIKLASMAVDGAKKVASLGLAFAKTSVGAFTDFSAKISGIAAVSGATTEELDQMSEKALELGAKFPVSASQAADAMSNLASAGFTARDAISASESVVVLAGAGQLDMAKSADILASSMNGFGLITNDTNKNIAEAARVTDLMAATANASAVSIQDIGYTMKYVAPVAASAGYSIEDMSKAIGMMGNAGIKGSSAGTALRSIVSSFAAPTAAAAEAFDKLGVKTQDSTGKMRPFEEVIQDMRGSFKNLSQADKIDLAKKIAGKEAMSALLSVVDASDESYQKMSDSIDAAKGSADKMAATMGDNLQGKLSNMQGSVETLQIKFGRALAPAVGAVYDIIGQLADRAAPFADALLPRVSLAVDKVKTAFDQAKAGFDLFLGAFSTGFVVPPEWEGLTATMGRLGTALAPLKTAVGDLIAAILPAATPANAAAQGMANMMLAGQNAHPVIDGISKLVTNFLVPGVQRAAELVDLMQLAFGRAQTALAPFLPTITSLGGTLLTVYQNLSPLNIAITAFEGFMSGGLPGMVTALGGNITNLGNAFGVDLSGPVTTVTNFINTGLVPGITSIASTVMSALPQIISFGQAFLNTVLPPIQGFIGWISTNVGPVVESAFNTFGTVVLPALQRFADFFGSTVIPKVSEFVSTIADKVKPILETGFAIIADTVIPTLGDLVAVVVDDVIPILMDWWGIIATVLSPVFDVVTSAIENVFMPAIKTVWGFIQDPLIPIFKNIANVMKTTVIPALQDMANFFNGTVKAAIDTIVKVWDGFTTRIADGASAIGKIFSGDLAGAADDLSKAVAGRTGEAGTSVDTFANVVALANTSIKGDLTTTGTDFTNLNTVISEETLKADQRITDFSINTRDESLKTTEKVSALGTSYKDLSTTATNAKSPLDSLSTSMSNSVTPSDNAKTSAGNAADSFKNAGTQSDEAKKLIDKYSNTTVTDKNANTNFSTVGSNIKTANDNLHNWNNTPAQNKTATYTTYYKTVGDKPQSNATGTNSFSGGSTFVAEEGPEAIKEPGKDWWTAMQPMFLPDLAKGTKILDAPATERFNNSRVSHPASAGQIMQSNSSTNITNQKVLNVNSVQSTGSILSDYALIDALS